MCVAARVGAPEERERGGGGEGARTFPMVARLVPLRSRMPRRLAPTKAKSPMLSRLAPKVTEVTSWQLSKALCEARESAGTEWRVLLHSWAGKEGRRTSATAVTNEQSAIPVLVSTAAQQQVLPSLQAIATSTCEHWAGSGTGLGAVASCGTDTRNR